ncbi:MAG: redoxin family protein [Dehalococcoidia bacterium]
MQTASENASASPEKPRSIRRVALYLLSISPVLLLIALLAWGQLRGNPGGLVEHNELGEVSIATRMAPAIDGVDLTTGSSISSGDLRGKIVMVDFWSSWCVACLQEANALASVYEEYGGEPVEFVGMAIWDESSDVLAHIEQFGVGYPNLLDGQGTSAIAYGVSGVPEKFFLDQDGRIIRKIIGPMTPERLRSVLDELLAS